MVGGGVLSKLYREPVVGLEPDFAAYLELEMKRTNYLSARMAVV